MRYRVKRHVIIRSENAAKPASQSSAFLGAVLRSLSPVERSFDYGCGKLRYTGLMLRRTDTLTVVDSEIQLSRKQMLGGRMSAVRTKIRSSNRVMAANVGEFRQFADHFDRGFCINVLSVIPIETVRRRVIDSIFRALRSGGTCLFVVQYRNSDFDRMLEMPNARRWRGGILIDSLRGFSYYGLISPKRLSKMITEAGFEIRDEILNEGSIYLFAAKNHARV